MYTWAVINIPERTARVLLWHLDSRANSQNASQLTHHIKVNYQFWAFVLFTSERKAWDGAVHEE